jgi:hypothetical protein
LTSLPARSGTPEVVHPVALTIFFGLASEPGGASSEAGNRQIPGRKKFTCRDCHEGSPQPQKIYKASKADVGLSGRSLTPAAGTRIKPTGIPDGWRIRGTKEPGGVLYRDPITLGTPCE